jgi:23S rRNA (cytosine1962-C5)-methyltransferase
VSVAKVVTLKKNEDRRITNGHLWAFSNEILNISGEPLAGDIVELRNHAGTLLGIGFYNPGSLIAVRLLSRQEEEIDFQFFHRRIESALHLRTTLYSPSGTFRLLHGESDFLPGLIVDKYNNQLAVQTLSFGMDKRLTLICDVLESIFHPQAIVERNDAPVRSLEGLEQRKGILRGSVSPERIVEHGVHYTIDLLEGQKTGFFLDQRENRHRIRRYAKERRVLDCFCNEGGFALNAAASGASEVIGIDISDRAIGRAAENSSQNTLPVKPCFLKSDCFDYLKEAATRGEKFDLIILDPPSFAKSKKSVRKAKKGYKELHTSAYRLLKPEGILATASCSHHVFEDTFLEIVHESARAAGRTISLLEWHGAAPDHPVLPGMPETRYLKFAVVCVR